jgi:hypothetical protein
MGGSCSQGHGYALPPARFAHYHAKRAALKRARMRTDNNGVARRRRGGKRRRLSNRSWLPILGVLGLGWLSQQPKFVLPVLLIAVGLSITALVWYARRGFIAKRRYRDLNRLKMLSPLEFERHVAEYYRRSGFRVTTGRFTASARALAAANHVELLDGELYVSQVTHQLGMANVSAVAVRKAAASY